ncbi:MAG: 4,5-DOPA dioxygenase extradiol [Reichenbachiella sp.]|uniref:4,5-DOPA-extradiol-dioxygenase n=1 Tax=Reichenbachiella sp. TaxID=2184521 RepID=UPI0029667D8F|nr:4,5-DOPA dioxygenase extradiol [Reichenbachiella sp.]MDW3212284.1 4,5-DOPA dioxygenase extradiol [Reichenbachiella sp.]
MKRGKFLKLLATTPMVGMSLKTWTKQIEDISESEKMPTLFVGHGNPMNAILENDITRGWQEMGKGLKPKAILCISAHWQTKGTMVTMTPKPRTIHDFGGFPKALFDVQYPAPGSPEMAAEVIQEVKKTTVEEDHEWGLDHGTWSVLIKMFPEADVPVFQLSLDYKQGPQYHYELAQELKALRKKGVLIVGSGNIIHNLRMARWDSDEPYDWALNFDQKTKEWIENNDYSTLINYSKIGQEAMLSIPTNEHYLPMLYTLALRDEKETLTFFNESILMGSMAMRSFVIGS